MSSRLILAAPVALAAALAAALVLASPVLAQTTAPAAPAAAAASAAAPTEEDVEAAAEAFKADMEKLSEEAEAARTAAGSDTAKADADIDALIARHQPVADAFADLLSAFLDSQAAVIPPEAMTSVLAQIRSTPSQVRTGQAEPAAQ